MKERTELKLLTNVSIAFVYREPGFGSETVSQSYMAENLEHLETDRDWYRVKQEDGYEAWIPTSFVVQKPEDWDDHDFFFPQNQISRILDSPDHHASALRDITQLSGLPILNTEDDWVEVLLPDGKRGWLKGNPRPLPATVDIEQLIETAHSFLGIQYFWGGRSPKGFDCSGFVQTCFKLNGMLLPRDAYQQADIGEQVSDNLDAWQVGDLIYFSERPERITHVAISLGGGKFIHASGFVKINSLNPDHEEIYTKKYADIYTKTMRVL